MSQSVFQEAQVSRRQLWGLVTLHDLRNRRGASRVVNLVQDSSHADARHGQQLLDKELGGWSGNLLEVVGRVVAGGAVVLPDVGTVKGIHGAGPLDWAELLDVVGSVGPRVLDVEVGGVTVSPVEGLRLPVLAGEG